MDFVKVEGLGNDFIVIEGDIAPSAEEIVRWCERRRGVGADGVLLIRREYPGAIRMWYWNADGSSAEMCGNGLRCAARLAVVWGWVEGPDVIVETASGSHPARVSSNGTVRALLGRPIKGRVERLSVAGVEVYPVSVGNPHAVRFVDDLSGVAVSELGRAIGTDPVFSSGANVEFVVVDSPKTIRMRIWERGVGETLGSGTGAAAGVFAAHYHGWVDQDVMVSLPGGDLQIELDGEEVWMCGDTNIVFQGILPDRG